MLRYYKFALELIYDFAFNILIVLSCTWWHYEINWKKVVVTLN